MEKLVGLTEGSNFVNSSREENRTFIAQVGSNKAGQFLEVAEYPMGGRRGPIIVPKGHERWGWKILAAEMRKVVSMFDSPPNKIHVVPPKLQPRDSGISSLISMGKDQVAEPGTTTTLPGRNGPFVKDEVYRLQRWHTRTRGLEM